LSSKSGCFLILRDSVMIKNQNELKAYLAQFIKLAEIVPVPMYWLDLNQSYLGINQHVLEGTGRKSYEKDFKGKTPYDVYPFEMAHEIVQHHKMVIQEGLPFRETEAIKDISGQIKQYDAIIAPFYNNAGEIIGTIGVSIEITAQIEAERKLQNANERLERANRAKSEFIANMSHDIRTPITGVVGVIQDLINAADNLLSDFPLESHDVLSQEKQLLPALKEITERIQHNGQLALHSVDELLQLLNEILEVTRLESGKVEEQLEAFDFRERIEHNLHLMRPAAKVKGLFLSATVDRDIPRYVNGLRLYFDRILLNLVSNALKFTDTGSVSINASLQLRGHEEVSIKIAVEDTGMGIPNNKFDTIFDYFSRLTNSHEGVHKGFGLGLYTVKQYVKAMHGEISVESQVEKGSCFSVVLPFTVASASVDRPHQSIIPMYRKQHKNPVALPLYPIVQGTKSEGEMIGKVLIVEDNCMATMALQVALAPFHCSIDVAEDGASAVKKAADEEYQLILIDVGLPDFSGIEATKRIRALKNPIKAAVPIVALTGHIDKASRNNCLQAGMNDVLSKPAQPLALEAIIQKFLLHPELDKEKNLPQASVHKNPNTGLALLDWEACL